MADPVQPHRSPVAKTGDIVEGRYRIIRVLDEGGMGTVYLAEHVLIKRRVAIKILHAELSNDSDVVERFMNEARAAGTLGHPNIVESTDMGFTRNEVPYIVFEYLEGTLLTDEIYRCGGLPVRRALRVAEQIASALYAAHNANIVHRDLKSDNVFLTDKDDALDHVKVLDFGISRFLEVEEEQGRRGMVMGTPEFMAPEQVTQPETVDRRADIYALGVILYEMLAARVPFKNDNDPRALLTRIVHNPPPPINRPEAPVGLQEMILGKLLAKDPAKRYQSMKDVQGALEAFHSVLRPSGPVNVPPHLQGVKPGEAPPHEPTPAPSPAPAAAVTAPAVPATAVRTEPPITPIAQKPRRSRIGWLVAAIVLGLAGGGLMYAEGLTSKSTNQAAITALEGDADKLAAAFDSVARAARMRVDGMASTPMLRAAMETDAATLKDMAGSDLLFTVNPGEVLEVFQIKDGAAPSSMLRLPPDAPALSTDVGKTWVETDGSRIAIIVGAPITKQNSGIVAGSLVMSVPVDLAPIKTRVAEHVLSATLVGLGPPIELARPLRPPNGTGVSVPVEIGGDLTTDRVVLAAVIAPVVRARKLALPRYALWGLGGMLLVIYLVGLLRSRSPG